MGQCTPNQFIKRSQSNSPSSMDSHKSPRSIQARSKKSFLPSNVTGRNTLAALNEVRQLASVDHKQKMKIKVPRNKSQTSFQWVDVEVVQYPSKIGQLPPKVIKEGTFQEKLAWFKAKIRECKKNYQHGFELIEINRQNLIESSLSALEGINLFKELRVKFTGDKAEDAGGGLLREWLHLSVKQIISTELGVFKLANSDETAYQLIEDSTATDESTFQALNLLGLLISKALIEGIPLYCPLDYSILRQLCSQKVQLCDVYSYDKALYQSWLSILEMPDVEQLCLDGTISHRTSIEQIEQVDVFGNGRDTLISNQNKEEYVAELANFYCTKSIEGYLEQLIQALTKFIPSQILSVFQPYQFDMLMNGPSIIDVKDWKENTKYEGYDSDEQIIQWFWEIVENSGQEGYRNLLHYCTGSTRVPIAGFAKLESNSGHIKKFCIRKIANSNENKYPKSYTCFNRLQLPAYETKQELREGLEFILLNQLNEFGLS